MENRNSNSGGGNRTLLDKTNSPLGIVIQFPIKKGPRTQLSLRTGLHGAHIEQTLIELQSTKSLVVQQSTKTPYLPRGSSSNMSQDEDDDFLDALINQNDEETNEEEEDGPLPVLRIIWECPMITRTVGIDDSTRNSFSGWSCGWCMKRPDGTEVPPFRGANARKALWHVLKEPGHDIRPCRGNIPRQKMRQYKELENSKALAKDLRTQKTASMMNNIQDLQDRTVLKMSSGRASALVLCALSPVSF